jgi:hypothetical protein
MADLPKIDSTGLRLAKLKGAARVSSVARITIQEGKGVGQSQSRPMHRNGEANGNGIVHSTSGRKESR